MGEVFHDDFSDGIWTKFAGNPVLRRDQPWAESHYLCEPNVVYEDGLFRVWFSQMFPANGKTALGYAISADGVTWSKHPRNPVLATDHVEIHRPYVLRHDGTYYLFAVDDEYHVLFRFALDLQGIKTSELQIRAEEPADVTIAQDVR